MTVCPFCHTIFCYEEAGEECPSCQVGELVDWDDYVLRMNASFMEGSSKETFTDDWLT